MTPGVSCEDGGGGMHTRLQGRSLGHEVQLKAQSLGPASEGS